MSELERASGTVVGPCLGVRAGEDVVIVVDRGTRAIGDALRDAAAALGAEPVMTVMEPRQVDGEEPPAAVAAALAAATVFIAPTTRSLSHTRARKAASERGARGATLPGVTEDMLARLMAADFDLMGRRSRAVAALLTGAGAAHVTCPRGTDFRADLTGREGIADDGDLRAPRRVREPALRRGLRLAARRRGDDRHARRSRRSASSTSPSRSRSRAAGSRTRSRRGGRALDGAARRGRPRARQGRNLAELGVGTNERATLTGLILEDEKMLGTVHVAFGASAGIGGTVSVPVHLDVLIEDATLDVDGTRVLDGGRFVLEA